MCLNVIHSGNIKLRAKHHDNKMYVHAIIRVFVNAPILLIAPTTFDDSPSKRPGGVYKRAYDITNNSF